MRKEGIQRKIFGSRKVYVKIGVPGGAAPAPGVALGVELVPVDATGELVEVVVAVEEERVLEVAPPALVTVAKAKLQQQWWSTM